MKRKLFSFCVFVIVALTANAKSNIAQHTVNASPSSAPRLPFRGNCEERCPFSVPVIKNMQKAAALFGI